MELTLVILAAGMGSRFGDKKQLVGFGPAGQLLPEYSIYDAVKAGFNRILWIIQESDRKAFDEALAKSHWDVPMDFAYQDLRAVPEGIVIPEERQKPWGTAHALLAAAPKIKGPFAIINADDYYGPSAYQALADFLRSDRPEIAMVLGYELGKTLSGHGSVTRGVLETKDGKLQAIAETSGLRLEGAEIVDNEGRQYSASCPISMNAWAFKSEILTWLSERNERFFREIFPENPLRSEFFLPEFVEELIREEALDVLVMPCSEQWFGVTHKEDREKLEAELRAMHERGLYPKTF